MGPQITDGLVTILMIACALFLYFAAKGNRRVSANYQPYGTPYPKPQPADDWDRPYRVYNSSFDQQVSAASLVTDEDATLAHAYLKKVLLGLPNIAVETVERLRETLCADASPATIVSLLVDNSGSMRNSHKFDGLAPPNSNIMLAALAASALCATLETLGTSTEILGFTTASWHGGEAKKIWIRNGLPEYPGRLCDLLHITYKSADEVGEDGRRHLGVMLHNALLKENVDGEALLWACDRLLVRPEPRRILIIISDGAPVDDSSLLANGPAFLERHIREVITEIESDPAITLGAVGIRHDVDRYYRRSVTIGDGDEVVNAVFNLLADILENKPGALRQPKPPSLS